MHAQSLGLNAEKIFRHRAEGEIFLLTFLFIGHLRVRDIKSGMFDCFRVARDTTAIPDHPLLVVSAVA